MLFTPTVPTDQTGILVFGISDDLIEFRGAIYSEYHRWLGHARLTFDTGVKATIRYLDEDPGYYWKIEVDEDPEGETAYGMFPGVVNGHYVDGQATDTLWVPWATDVFLRYV